MNGAGFESALPVFQYLKNVSYLDRAVGISGDSQLN